MTYFLCFVFPPLGPLCCGRVGAFLLNLVLWLFACGTVLFSLASFGFGAYGFGAYGVGLIGLLLSVLGFAAPLLHALLVVYSAQADYRQECLIAALQGRAAPSPAAQLQPVMKLAGMVVSIVVIGGVAGYIYMRQHPPAPETAPVREPALPVINMGMLVTLLEPNDYTVRREPSSPPVFVWTQVRRDAVTQVRAATLKAPVPQEHGHSFATVDASFTWNGNMNDRKGALDQGGRFLAGMAALPFADEATTAKASQWVRDNFVSTADHPTLTMAGVILTLGGSGPERTLSLMSVKPLVTSSPQAAPIPTLSDLATEWSTAHPDAQRALMLAPVFLGLWAAVALVMQMRRPPPMVIKRR